MGASYSEYSEERDPVEINEALALQQQRAQFLLMQQLQEARAAQLGPQWGGNGNTADAQLMQAAALGAFGGLSAVPMRPVEQPALRQSKILRNPAHLRGKTLRLQSPPNADGSGTQLCFEFDAAEPGMLTVHRKVKLLPSKLGSHYIESALWSSEPFSFKAGIGQSHSLPWAQLPESAIATPQMGFGDVDLSDRLCDLLIELEAEPLPSAREKSVDVETGGSATIPDRAKTEWTFARDIADGAMGSTTANGSGVEVIRQQVYCSSGEPLDVLEVFGSELAADGRNRQECIVCQCEPRDTAVLPCRHMCLCSGCAEYIRTRVQYRSFKCPICRERISRMMQLEGEGEDPETEVPPTDGAGEQAAHSLS